MFIKEWVTTMEKTISIHALVSAQNLAAPVDVAEAAPIAVQAEISTIGMSETNPGAAVLTEEIATLNDDTSDLSEEMQKCLC